MTDSDSNVDVMDEESIRIELDSFGIILHHKTGVAKLKETLMAARNGTYVAPAPIVAPPAPPAPPAPLVSPAAAKDTVSVADTVKVISGAELDEKLTKTQRAMRLVRVVVTPNDPLMSTYPGLIFTVGSSSVNNGRMIKKFVPFNNDLGWHIPQIILDQIESAQMQKFRTATNPKGEKYLTSYVTKKFNVQILPPLNQTEMAALAAAQASRGGV